MKSAFAALTSCFDQALLAALDIDGTELAPLVVPSSNPKFGDFQSNVAMALAKRLKMNPQKIAEHIVDKLDVNEFCEAPQVVRPGFINLRLKKSYLERQLQSMSQSERLGVAIPENRQQVIVDYPSPNIAK
ncbi:MAG: arginine--tRNA ligase, partial [Cyanobacteria bacterium P01_H01_bin.15]